VDGLVTVHDHSYVPPTSPSKPEVITSVHGIGHEGVQKTLHRLCSNFFIPVACSAVQDFVRACDVCQHHKMKQLHQAGLLQPLDLPDTVLTDLSMDFIKGLLRVNIKSMILTIVDRFSKAVHFILLAHPYTATTVTQAFFDAIVHLHGIPSSIVSDWDLVFTSHFLLELFSVAGVKLNLSSAFHPQLDSKSRAVDKIIIMYLLCLIGDRPRHWLQWLT
jgi:hypothetical protein